MSFRSLTVPVLVAVMACGAVAAQDVPLEYHIGPKDLLELKVLELPEMNVERRVTDAGTVDLPLLGEVDVNGLTNREASARIGALLMEKYVNRANVSVVIRQFGNKPLSIVGAVGSPGSLSVSGRYSLLQAITAAGGLRSDAGKKIYVMRTAQNGLTDVLEVKTDDLYHSPTGEWNIPVYPSDVINVPPKTAVTIFCMGELKNAGALQFDPDDRITLLSVIAKAGGLTDRASKQIRIKRQGDDGKDVEFTVNYRAVLSGSVPDPQLRGNDLVIVKESFF